MSTAEVAEGYARAHGVEGVILCDPGGKAARAYGPLVNLGFLKFARKLTVLVNARGIVERSWRDITGPAAGGGIGEDARPAAALTRKRRKPAPARL